MVQDIHTCSCDRLFFNLTDNLFSNIQPSAQAKGKIKCTILLSIKKEIKYVQIV